MLSDQRGFHALSRDFEAENEVFVGNCFFVFDSQPRAVSVWTLNVCGVSFRIDLIEDQTGVERDFE